MDISMKKLGFKGTLLLTVSLIMVLAISSSAFLSYRTTSQVLTDTIYQHTQDTIRTEGEFIESFINTKTKAISAVSEEYQRFQYKNGHADRMVTGSHAGDLEALMIGFENGDSYLSTVADAWKDHKNPADYDVRTRPWYINARNTSEVIYTDPYTDLVTGKQVVSIAKKFDDGVVVGDITLDVLSKTVSNVKMKGAIALIMDEKSSVLASSSSAVKVGDEIANLSSLSHIVSDVKGAENNIIDYELDGIDKVMFSQRINYGDQYWYLLIGLDKHVVFSALEEVKNQSLAMASAFIIASVLLILIALNVLYRPILSLKKTIIGLSNGNRDLTQRLEVNSSDDLGQISQGVNLFIANIQELMVKIETASSELKNNVSSLRNQASDNSSILDQHVQETEQIIAAIEEMSATANTVAQNASDAAQSTKEAENIGVNSLDVVSQAQAKVRNLVTDVESTASSLQTMSAETKEINKVLSVIGGIAEQTNLLALNAAIEAARAGEQGRGFAVVADEVRALASRTQSSTEEVERALSRLLNGNEKVVQAMDGTKITCSEAYQSTEKVSQSLNELSGFVTAINDLNIQIATAAEEQSSVTQEISRNMASLGEIVSQLNSNGNNTLDQAESITNVNEQLVKMLGLFKLR
jgi:methyl-accepting chemotaxis protein